jgi:predicted nucleic-acid-binding protein
MIGIDTNVLIRFLLKDDAKQAARALRFMRDEITATTPGHISLVTLLETVWVLDSLYEFSVNDQLAVVEDLLSADALVVAERAAVTQAVALARSKNADFQDCLVLLLDRAAGCDKTVTFDAKAAKRTGMIVLT